MGTLVDAALRPRAPTSAAKPSIAIASAALWGVNAIWPSATADRAVTWNLILQRVCAQTMPRQDATIQCVDAAGNTDKKSLAGRRYERP